MITAAQRADNARAPTTSLTPQDTAIAPLYDPSMPPPGSDVPLEIKHPLLRRLLDLWNVKRDGRVMPARADFDVFELKDWLGNLMLIEVLDGASEFRYRLYGSVLAAYYSRDLTGKLSDTLPPETRDIVRREYGEVCAARRPMLVERRRSVKQSTRMVAKLILPLASDGLAVDMILAASYPL